MMQPYKVGCLQPTLYHLAPSGRRCRGGCGGGGCRLGEDGLAKRHQITGCRFARLHGGCVVWQGHGHQRSHSDRECCWQSHAAGREAHCRSNQGRKSGNGGGLLKP